MVFCPNQVVFLTVRPAHLNAAAHKEQRAQKRKKWKGDHEKLNVTLPFLLHIDPNVSFCRNDEAVSLKSEPHDVLLPNLCAQNTLILIPTLLFNAKAGWSWQMLGWFNRFYLMLQGVVPFLYVILVGATCVVQPKTLLYLQPLCDAMWENCQCHYDYCAVAVRCICIVLLHCLCHYDTMITVM